MLEFFLSTVAVVLLAGVLTRLDFICHEATALHGQTEGYLQESLYFLDRFFGLRSDNLGIHVLPC